MRTMNKSFIFGIVAASITWSISLYLYWTLLHNVNSGAADDHSSPSAAAVQKNPFQNNGAAANNLVNSIDGAPDGRKHSKDSLYLEKVQRYRKEKKFRKISQHLIDQLKPRIDDAAADFSDQFGMVRNADEQYLRDIGYKRHAFNILVSQNLGFIRDIPDTRHKLCASQTVPAHLPTASVIICFYNEHIITLLRSIQTVLQRTPVAVLQEIILVDDASDLDDLKRPLEVHLDALPQRHLIRLHRNGQREGLIRSRVFGARNATGDALIFLDSHIEVNVGWAEPLLARIQTNRTTLVMPVIDIINADTFSYTSSPLVRGGFNWGLHFKWDNLPKGIFFCIEVCFFLERNDRLNIYHLLPWCCFS